MKKTGLLNRDLSEVIASMGHMDQLTVCDAGLPIPDAVRRIELALIPNLPTFLDTLAAVASELKVETLILARELSETHPALVEAVQEYFPEAETVLIPHDEFKKATQKSRAVVRTGECTPYANVHLISGVIF